MRAMPKHAGVQGSAYVFAVVLALTVTALETSQPLSFLRFSSILHRVEWKPLAFVVPDSLATLAALALVGLSIWRFRQRRMRAAWALVIAVMLSVPLVSLGGRFLVARLSGTP
jgi:hypothetical protein